jgi:hypothetical protein
MCRFMVNLGGGRLADEGTPLLPVCSSMLARTGYQVGKYFLQLKTLDSYQQSDHNVKKKTFVLFSVMFAVAYFKFD